MESETRAREGLGKKGRGEGLGGRWCWWRKDVRDSETLHAPLRYRSISSITGDPVPKWRPTSGLKNR